MVTHYESFTCYFGLIILATGVFNTEPKDSEVNKKNRDNSKRHFKKKSAEEKVKSEEEAQAEAEQLKQQQKQTG